MAHYLGLDSSTQSLSAVLIDTESGKIVAAESVNFGRDLPHYGQPHGYLEGGPRGEVHADPLMWVEALDLLLTRMKAEGVDFSEVRAVSGSGQQHGSVYLNAQFAGVLGSLDAGQDLRSQLSGCLARATSPIWMDSSTTEECREIASAVGGNEVVCAKSGSIAIERFTGPQIRKFAKADPSGYVETAVIHLVSSFFASIMAGRSVAIDWGDGAGMNLMNLSAGDWDDGLLAATAEGLREKLPGCQKSSTKTGPIAGYFVKNYGFSPTCETILWSGDNPCSLVGMGASTPGKVVISLGTSDTLFAAMAEPKTDPQGYGHVFGNPVGGYMSLICFKNGSLAREAVKDAFDLEWRDFEVAALAQTPVGNGGLMMLPFYEPEITPAMDSGGPVFSSDHSWSGAEMARAVLEGQFLNMKSHSDWLGVAPTRISLTGGASENDGIAQIVADVFGVPVDRLEVPGSAAVGAAMRAAHGMGEDLAALENTLCRPSEGKTREPQAAAVAIYREIEPKFRAFLQATKEKFPLGKMGRENP